MANSKNKQDKSKMSQITSRLISSLRWLTKPASSLPESLIDKSALLVWMLLMVITLALASIIAIPLGTPYRMAYIVAALAAVPFFIIAFIVNRIGHYRLAALLTILGAAAAPWSTLLTEDTIVLQGDLIPLIFVAISILLSSLLLPPLTTALVAGIQLAAFVSVLSLVPLTTNQTWIILLLFIIIISAISILSSFIRRRDQKQIAQQKRLLVLSEAKLREQSIHDHLTGLYNRRYLDETIEREIQRAERAAYPIGIIMLDIDHFKQLNDTFGHAAGDMVLQKIATLLKAKIRHADIICRYGGEEFVVVMPEASLNATVRRAETVREEVRELNLQYQDQNLGRITISSGVAVFPDHGSTAQAVMKAADSALYAAKDSGRDRVVAAS